MIFTDTNDYKLFVSMDLVDVQNVALIKRNTDTDETVISYFETDDRTSLSDDIELTLELDDPSHDLFVEAVEKAIKDQNPIVDMTRLETSRSLKVT